MIGTNPYNQNKTQKSLSEQLNDYMFVESDPNAAKVDKLWEAFVSGNWETIKGEFENDMNLLNDIISGKYNDGLLTSVSNNVLEELGYRDSGLVLLNNHPFHVEPGSLTIKPKLNIAQQDMYLDADDGKSYTYLQWLNTTGVVLNFTIYNRSSEHYYGKTTEDTQVTKTDTNLNDASTKVNEILLWWADTYTTVHFWTGLPIPNLAGKYKITNITQTVVARDIIKTELELTSYTQEDMEETYYKVYDASELTGRDLSKETTLSTKIESIGDQEKECDCEPLTGSESSTNTSTT